MITIVGLFLLALACVGYASEALDDTPRENAPDDKLGGPLLALCFVAVLGAAAKQRKQRDDDLD